MDKNIKIVIGVIGILILVGLSLVLSFLVSDKNTTNVAIIPIYGSIDFSGSYSSTHPDIIKNLINKANNDESIGAIVLDINSPGGTAVAADEMSYAVKNSKKPIVAWISDLGASAAYLVASNSDKIVASRNSLVGNIGTLMEFEDNSEQYEKKGTKKYVIKGGKYKDIMSDYRNMTSNESKMIQKIVDEDYDGFIEDIAENRNLTKDYVKTIADGKIYNGNQALTAKLIDSVGLKEDALQLAANLTGSSSYSEVNYSSTFSETIFITNMLNIIDEKTGLSLHSLIN